MTGTCMILTLHASAWKKATIRENWRSILDTPSALEEHAEEGETDIIPHPRT